LSNRDPKQKFELGLEALKSINYDNLKEILTSARKEIVDFISQEDEISGLEIKIQIGLDNEVIDELDDYIKIVQVNFELLMNYFEKNSQ